MISFAMDCSSKKNTLYGGDRAHSAQSGNVAAGSGVIISTTASLPHLVVQHFMIGLRRKLLAPFRLPL